MMVAAVTKKKCRPQTVPCANAESCRASEPLERGEDMFGAKTNL